MATLVFGPRLVKIRGNYDDVNRLCTEIADEYGWAIVNVNLRPYYTEGAKTHGFEIAEQLGWRLPKHTVVPVAGGTILPKVWKAYREFIDLGLVADDGPRIHAAQAAGCNPVVARDRVRGRRVPAAEAATPSPRASRSAIPRTGPTRSASSAIRAASRRRRRDDEILDAIELLARTEGIFTEPAGGTTLACAIKLIESGRIPKDESICVSITGNGLKTIEAQQGRLPEVPVIEAKLEAFAAIAGAAEEPACAAGSG